MTQHSFTHPGLRRLWLFFCCAAPVLISGQAEPVKLKNHHKLLIPVIFKTPEMGVAAGISGSYTFKTTHAGDTSVRTSIIQAIGFVTSHRQNVQALDAAIYAPGENYIFLAQLAHSYFPDKFWGTGPGTENHPYEYYVYEQAYASAHVKRKIRKNLFIGGLYEFQTLYRMSSRPGGMFDSACIAGKSPYQVSGFGLSLSYDSRNSSFWPSKGVYLLTQVTNFRKETYSSYDLYKWITDLRYFKKISSNQIMAFQLYNYGTAGTVPLKELAALGGPNNMRGFYQGRFRAGNMLTFITEYRIHIKGRWSTCFFGGLGDVYDHASELGYGNVKYSYGGGLRFAVVEKEKLNIRVDYGYSDKFNRGLYITFGECF